MKKIILLLFICIGSFIPAGYSQGKTDGLPITVRLNTSVNFPDGSVELAGISNSIDNEPGQVHIEIIKPGGGTDNISARADKQTGEYFVKYTPTETGKYQVIAYAADKKQTAKTTFSVLAEFDADEMLDKFDAAKDKAVNALESSLNALVPELAPEHAAKTKLETQKLKQQIKEFDGGWDKLKKSLQDLQTLSKKYPEIRAIAAPQLGQLSSKLQESSDLLKQIEKDLGTSKSQQSDICNKFYQVGEACALFSTTMNFASGGIIAIGKSIFIDKVWPKISEKVATNKFDNNDKFFFTQSGKAGLSALDDIKSLQTKSFGAGMAGDFVQYVSGELFSAYCTEYKGPISGDFAVEMQNEGKVYLRYKLYYEGKASLYCLKEKAKGALPKLSGYLEGNVVKMEFTDDVWAVEDKSDWEEIKNQRIPAPVMPFNASEKDPGFGAAARGAMPGAFYFPLQAQIVQEKMVIKLMPALSDFTSAFSNRTVMVVKAKQQPYNVDGAVFEYPINKATFILQRSMRMQEKSPTVTLPITKSNGTNTMTGDFNRTETLTDTKVDFNMKMTLVNEPWKK
ncbi:MAG: hypothetical protein SGI83_05655 [Bacteroidota bacterium]|nr:hypothetical protein [Bacteroidota bacterium]